MKIREGFISNSSSTSFVIMNNSSEHKTLQDFVIENKHLIDEFNRKYDFDYTLEEALEDIYYYNYKWEPNESLECIFGDEECNVIGMIYDYILRDGGTSENFKWCFNKYLR